MDPTVRYCAVRTTIHPLEPRDAVGNTAATLLQYILRSLHAAFWPGWTVPVLTLPDWTGLVWCGLTLPQKETSFRLDAPALPSSQRITSQRPKKGRSRCANARAYIASYPRPR